MKKNKAMTLKYFLSNLDGKMFNITDFETTGTMKEVDGKEAAKHLSKIAKKDYTRNLKIIETINAIKKESGNP